MEISQLLTLSLGLIGAVLGLRAEIWRRKDFSRYSQAQRRAENEALAKAILSARPLVKNALAIPLWDTDIGHDTELCSGLARMRANLLAVSDALVEAQPQTLTFVETLRDSIIELERLSPLKQPLSEAPAFAEAMAEFYGASWQLAVLCAFAPVVGNLDERRDTWEYLQKDSDAMRLRDLYKKAAHVRYNYKFPLPGARA